MPDISCLIKNRGQPTVKCGYMCSVESGNAKWEIMGCAREAGKQKKPYEAKWTDCDERKKSTEKRSIYLQPIQERVEAHS